MTLASVWTTVGITFGLLLIVIMFAIIVIIIQSIFRIGGTDEKSIYKTRKQDNKKD
ncbi:hypothetical protein IJD44_07830 [bacterium]|nr:hypothetical protein [bacterium]